MVVEVGVSVTKGPENPISLNFGLFWCLTIVLRFPFTFSSLNFHSLLP